MVLIKIPDPFSNNYENKIQRNEKRTLSNQMKNILIICLVFFTSKSVSQNYELRSSPYLESEITYKDGSREKGLIRLANSVFDIRFKADAKEKEKKVSYKDIEQIITNPDSTNTRIFEYRETYKNKFRTFVELIHQDEINIYLGAVDGTKLFYSGLDIRSAREAMGTDRIQKSEQHLKLSNGLKILLPFEYQYDDYDTRSTMPFKKGEFEAYLGIAGKKLIPVEPRKRFSKKYLQYFSECPQFSKRYETGEIELENLPGVITAYGTLCRVE